MRIICSLDFTYDCRAYVRKTWRQYHFYRTEMARRSTARKLEDWQACCENNTSYRFSITVKSSQKVCLTSTSDEPKTGTGTYRNTGSIAAVGYVT